MFTVQGRFRFTAVRFAIIAVIGITFLTLAVVGAGAAGASVFDSVREFFGMGYRAESVQPGVDAGRAAISTTFVISQAYGGGGGTTGTYMHDYVELKNISSSPQSLGGLSLMYGSATGQFASLTTNAYALASVTVQPGQYYLVELSPAGTMGAPLPVTPDEVTTNLSMSGTNGKVALVTSAFVANTCGATATPCTLPNADIVDLVAWGTANNAEGGASTNGGASITSVQGNVRKNGGCQETDNNNADFDIITAPVPRNTATAAAPCTGGPTPTLTATSTGSPTPTNTPTNTATATATATASPSPVQGSTLVISQAYGGGGGTTGTYIHDYVELKNISSSVQSLGGLSLMYGSATGQFASTTTNAYALANATLQPGQYYLVELSPAGTMGAPLPVTPDEVTTNLNMSGTNGKVALVTSAFVANTCGATATPCTLPDPNIVDLVAWGTANNAEGGASTNGGASLTSVQGNVRKLGGCQDTNNNNNDFDIATAPVPRNTATAAAPCAGGPSATPTSTATSTATNTATNTPTNTATATSTATPQASPTCTTMVTLSGAQEVPPNNSTATGTGTVSLSADLTTLTVSVSFGGLTAAATAGHIHGPAGPGANAAIVFPFSGVPAAPQGTVPTQSFAISPAQLAQLQAGLFYINIHTSTFPGGEIRGQIVGGGCITPTPTSTATPTSTTTPSNTPTVTATNTATATPTSTSTSTPANTPTNTPTSTSTSTPTNTPTFTPTGTATNTATPTPTPGTVFANAATICTTLGAPAAPYPSTIMVANGPNQIDGVRVTLFNVTHQLPDNMDFLLVGPNGAKFILMADAGGPLPLATPGVTLTFSDSAGAVLPNTAALTTGTFEPTNWETPVSNFPAPAPPGPYNEPGSTVGGTGTQTLGGNFRLSNSNGAWNLYMRDDDGLFTEATAITGCVNGGWQLEFIPTTAASLGISGRVTTASGNGIRNARVVLTGNLLPAPRNAQTGSFGYYTFEGLRAGETYVLTVNSRRYTFSMPSRVISLVDNVIDADFIADPQE